MSENEVSVTTIAERLREDAAERDAATIYGAEITRKLEREAANELDRLSSELSALTAERDEAMKRGTMFAQANHENARRLLEEIGGDPAYSLGDNARMLRERAATLESRVTSLSEVLTELVRLEHIKLSQPASPVHWRSEAERIEYLEKWPLAWKAAFDLVLPDTKRMRRDENTSFSGGRNMRRQDSISDK